MSAPDLVVVGGGIIGLSTAFLARRAGLAVTVLERDRIGAGAAGVAAGMLAPVLEVENEERALIPLCTDSVRRYPDFVGSVEAASGLEVGYRTLGSLLCATRRDDLQELERTARLASGLGFATEWLEAGALCEREPWLSPRLLGGLYAAQDRQVDPRALLRALAAALAALGVTVEEGVADLGLERGASGRIAKVRYRCGTEIKQLPVGAVLVAAGAWSPAVLAAFGIDPGPAGLPLRPVKGQILRLRGAPLLRHVVRSPHVYLVPRGNGELVVGATSEEQGFDARPTAGAALDLLREAFLCLPGIYELELCEHGVGFRPALRDHLPAIGPWPKAAGLYLATGHYRHGVLLAPATAAALVELLTSGALPAVLAPFQPSRFEGASG